MADNDKELRKYLTDEEKKIRRSLAAKKAAQTRAFNKTAAGKKSAAAKKGWQTRKAKMTQAEKRSAAAKKAAKTRRSKTPEFKRRSEAAKKGWETRRKIQAGVKVIKEVREIIDNWRPEPHWSDAMTAKKEEDKNILKAFFEQQIADKGEKTVAIRLEAVANQAIPWAETICYDSDDDKVENALQQFTYAVMDRSLNAEEWKQIEEQAEAYNQYH